MRDTRTPWVAALSELYERHAGDTPRHGSGKWKVILQNPLFQFVGTSTRDFAHPTSHAGVVDRVLSTSFIAALPEAEKVRIREEVAALLEDDPTLRGKDEFVFPYVTELHLLRKI